MQGLNLSQPGLKHDPQWFRKAVFYEVLVRAFADSKGVGAGDFTGLIQRLDYLQWLGVDCLWLPPFYASPLRDGGYDIADYTAVLPEFGTLPDFQELVSQAHARGIRVITDFVMNHTSDQHPWFQSSRSNPDGPYGDFYVWSDTDELYQDARIIFVDTEPSNWTWDHGCWSEVWFMTKSMITRMPREWAASRNSWKSSMEPTSGSTPV